MSKFPKYVIIDETLSKEEAAQKFCDAADFIMKNLSWSEAPQGRLNGNTFWCEVHNELEKVARDIMSHAEVVGTDLELTMTLNGKQYKLTEVK